MGQGTLLRGERGRERERMEREGGGLMERERGRTEGDNGEG